MEFINNGYQQLLDLFKSMTVAARITSVLLLAVLVVSITFLFQQQTTEADSYLFGAQPLTQREIDTMTLAFTKATLNDYEVHDHRIRVPRERRHEYLAALAEANAYPEHPGSSWDRMFDSDTPFVSRQVRQLKARQAKEREMAATVRSISGIEEALVDFDEVEKGGMPPRTEKRALVSVRAVGNQTLDDHLVRSIASAVSFGAGIDNGNVTVLDLNTGVAYPGKGKQGAHQDEHAYARAQERYERHYKEKIEHLLAMIPGVRVNVFVDLDKNLKNATESQTYEGQPLPVRTTEYSKDVTARKPLNQGRPGLASNVGNTPVTVGSTPQESNETTQSETRSESDNLAGMTREITEVAALVPTYVKAGVLIPRSHLKKIWLHENPPDPSGTTTEPDKAALAEIEARVINEVQESVAAVLPEPSPGIDKFPRISVRTFTETPIATSDVSGVVAETTTWLGSNWSTLGMFLVAAAGLIMLRKMTQGAPSDPLAPTAEQMPAITLPITEEEPLEEEDDDGVDVSNTLKARFQNSQRSLRDELSELVKEDPDAAASVLQGWIGDAA